MCVCVCADSIYGPQLGTCMFGVVCLPVMLSQQLHLADATLAEPSQKYLQAVRALRGKRRGGELNR